MSRGIRDCFYEEKRVGREKENERILDDEQLPNGCVYESKWGCKFASGQADANRANV